MGSPQAVRNEPSSPNSDQPPVPEPTAAVPENPQQKTQERPPPQRKFSRSKSIESLLLPPLICESLVPEFGTSDNLNPEPPLSILASIASETPNPMAPELGTQNCTDSLIKEIGTVSNQITSELPLKKKTRIVVKLPKTILCEDPSPVQTRPRTKRKPRTKTEVVLPRNQSTIEPPLKKTRTVRQKPDPKHENPKSTQRKPQAKRKAPTGKKPGTTTRQKSRRLAEVGRPETDKRLNREVEIEASQIDTNEGGEEVEDRPAKETAPPESDTRNSQTPVALDAKTQETPSVQNVIPISVYVGGEVRYNQMGAEYSIPPKFTFAGTQQTTFEDVKNEITNCLNSSEKQLSLNIQARYNAVPSGPFFFTLLAINDDRAWRLVYEMAVSGLNWRIIELYVKLVPNQTPQNANSDPNYPQWSSYNVISSQAEPCTNSANNNINTFQYSVPGIFNRFTKGQNPSPSELIPFANVGSFLANQIFKSKKHLWFAISDLHIKANLEIALTSSSESGLVVRCNNKKCQWKIHAAPMQICSNWSIKSCSHPHTCQEATSKFIRSELNIEIIKRVIRSEIQHGSELKIVKLHESVLKTFPGAQASYNNLWHARMAVVEELFGNWEESYALLPRLFDAIKSSNLDTKIEFESGNQRFDRVAWAFAPCINAYKFLRPVISVKSFSLLGKYDGRLLIACGYDADDEPVPLAFSLVNEENEINWVWFMRFIRQNVICNNQLVCVITDCDGCVNNVFQGTDDQSDEAIEKIVHRFCVQNVSDSLFKTCKNIELIDMFKSAARKTRRQKFEEARNAIRIKSPETYLYLETLGQRKKNHNNRSEPSAAEKWAQYEDNGYRYGIMSGKCTEILKRVFKGCRHLPVTAIVENTFNNCMRWFSQRRSNAAKQAMGNKFRPDRITEVLQRRTSKAQGYYVNFVYSRKMYEVGVKRMTEYGLTYLKYNVTVVSKTAPECECQKLKFTGIPCSHVIAVGRKLKIDPKRFVNSYYSLEMLVNTWSGQFRMYGNESEWPEYSGAVIVPDESLLRTRPRKPENHNDNGGK